MKVEPIFILGSARNGTTWFANSIANSNEIAKAEHILHHGLDESNICQHKMYWGDLSKLDNYIRFVEQYSAGDYFQLISGEKEDLYRNKKDNFFDLYLDQMDKFANREKKKYWMTKLDPYFYIYDEELIKFIEKLNKKYETIHFFAIKRDLMDVLKSYISMEGKYNLKRQAFFMKYLALLLGVARYTVHYQKIDEIVKTFNAKTIDYVYFKKNKENVLKSLFNIIGVEPPENIDRFKANTSFKNKDIKDNNKFTIIQTLFIKVVIIIFKIFPKSAKGLIKFWDKLKGQSCPEFYRLKKSELC